MDYLELSGFEKNIISWVFLKKYFFVFIISLAQIFQIYDNKQKNLKIASNYLPSVEFFDNYISASKKCLYVKVGYKLPSVKISLKFIEPLLSYWVTTKTHCFKILLGLEFFHSIPHVLLLFFRFFSHYISKFLKTFFINFSVRNLLVN